MGAKTQSPTLSAQREMNAYKSESGQELQATIWTKVLLQQKEYTT
jgi:hypothetical protein